MGVDVQLTLYAATETTANDAARRAFRRIAELERVFSDYDPDSEAMRLCRLAQPNEFQPVSDDLFTVLSAAQDLAQRSNGAFDVTIGPVVKLWRRARRRQELPEAAVLAEARALVGYRQIRLDPSTRSVSLARTGLQLDFGGIAKGYAAQEAVAALKAAGCSSALVAVAGDIVAGDPPPDAPGWKVGVASANRADAPPFRWLCLANAAVSTSGDAFQHVVIDGVRYSHIVDPRTGLGLTRLCGATVISGNGMTADSLATAAILLGPREGARLIQETPGAAALIVCDSEGRMSAQTVGDFARWEWPE